MDNENTITLSKKEREEAIQLLKNQNLLQTIVDDLDKIGLAGEETNKKALIEIGASRQLDKPLNFTIHGESSAGKNYIVDKVFRLFPPEDVIFRTRITPTALYHLSSELSHKILFVGEYIGSQGAEYAIRTIEEDGGLSVDVVTKNPKTGGFETKTKKVEGPIVYGTSTTKTHLNLENDTRHLDLHIDETMKQTRDIFQKIKEEYKAKNDTSLPIIKKWQNCFRLLKPCKVVIPYADEIKFPEKPIRVRRDFRKFLTLIASNCHLHQYQRSKVELNGAEYLEANIDDYGVAYELSMKIIFNSLFRTSPRLEKVKNECLKLALDSLTQCYDKIFKSSAVVNNLKDDMSHTTVLDHLRYLTDSGFLETQNTSSRGKPRTLKIVGSAVLGQLNLLKPKDLEDILAKKSLKL